MSSRTLRHQVTQCFRVILALHCGETLRASYREELGVIAPGISLRVLVVVDKLNLGQVNAVVVGLQYLLKLKI